MQQARGHHDGSLAASRDTRLADARSRLQGCRSRIDPD
jgi:hypothetical protein